MAFANRIAIYTLSKRGAKRGAILYRRLENFTALDPPGDTGGSVEDRFQSLGSREHCFTSVTAKTE